MTKTYEDSAEEEKGLTTIDDKALATQASSPLAGYTTEPVFEQGEAYIPRFRLAQGLTAEVQNGEAKPGQWLLIGNVPVDEMVIVPVAFARKREMRDAASRDIMCFSVDGIKGQGIGTGDCATCPLGQWQPNPDHDENDPKSWKNMPPSCDQYFSYIVYSVTHDAMAVLELRKSALKPGRILNTMAKQAGLSNFAVVVGSTKNQGTKGTFATPSFKAVNSEEAEQFLALAADAFNSI